MSDKSLATLANPKGFYGVLYCQQTFAKVYKLWLRLRAVDRVILRLGQAYPQSSGSAAARSTHI